MIISTNILSDYSKHDFSYIVTSSADAVSAEISTSLEKRYRCISLIGSYGTGKSSFLYALIKSIQGEVKYFPSLNLKGSKVLKSIGQYESLLTHFARLLKTSGDIESIFLALRREDSSNERVYIFIDEFGKLIEYALKNDPKKETYYFQQLAEFINNDLKHTILVSTLHQSFESYSYHVGSADIAEWEKVSGRFHSITFNEPHEVVAQIVLKHFAGYFTFSKSLASMTKIACDLNLIPEKFQAEDLNSGSIGNMDGLTTYVAIGLFRKYAQNERSVFSFLNDSSIFGVKAFSNSNFALPELYDYVLNRFTQVIYSQENPDKLQWESAERAIQRADSHHELRPDLSHRILKSIHLINLFARGAGKFNVAELLAYLEADRNDDFQSELKLLSEKNIIHFINYKGRLTFVEGTDVNLEEELRKAAGRLPLNANYDQELMRLVSIDPIVAKQHLFETGTPRLWFFLIQTNNSEINELQKVLPTNGLIVIQFNNTPSEPIEMHGIPVVTCQCDITDEMKSAIERIRKFEIVINEYKDDIVVRNLVQLELDFATRELKSELTRQLCFRGTWTYNGSKKEVDSIRRQNSVLSEIFDDYYNEHPIVVNELINRGRLSASINSARKKLLDSLITNGSNLEFDKDKYPPERMIFESTLVAEGMIDTKSQIIVSNDKSSYFSYWRHLDEILEESRHQKRPFTDFIDQLSTKPFGMKEGLIKFLLSYYLIANKDGFALTHEPSIKFIPYLHVESIESMFLKPKEFFIKKYNFDRVPRSAIDSLIKFSGIERANQPIANERSAFFGIYAQLSRSISELPAYTRNTKVGLNPKSVKLLEAIKMATDPEKALLVEMPLGLGFKPMTEHTDKEYADFFKELEDCVMDLKGSFPRLIVALKNHFLKCMGGVPSNFESEKEFIREFISTINIDILGPYTKGIIMRILSPLADEVSYWKAIFDAIADFNLYDLKDENLEKVKLNISSFSDTLMSLVGMVETEAYNVGISITQKDGTSNRKFSNPLTLLEAQNSHLNVLKHLRCLNPQIRLNLIAYIIQNEL